ncbi:hypothetical protein [Tepidibacillus marianensis]|uniref:DprA-like winged helix domain-containing protein n=1 Tax=Tepidibacillus marianensis TaxID=3131995 RepID=UPI0030D3AD38
MQNVENINEEFPYLIQQKESKQKANPVNLSKNEQKVYSIICEKVHIDVILTESKLSSSDVYESLLSLQLKGMTQQMAGGYYRRKGN